jgi:hypothetical protein
MLSYLILLWSFLPQQESPNIYKMSISEIYFQAEKMTSFNFGFQNFTDSVRSNGFDFVAIKPESSGTGEGYFMTYYYKSGIHNVVKFSADNQKEYVVFVDSRGNGLSFLWMFSYKSRSRMVNGFFLNIWNRELFFFGLSRLRYSTVEHIDYKGNTEKFDFGTIYSLPEGDVGLMIGEISYINKELLPTAILHVRHGKPFGFENVAKRTLMVFSNLKYFQDCQGDITNLKDVLFSDIYGILSADSCSWGKMFDLKNSVGSWEDYYGRVVF